MRDAYAMKPQTLVTILFIFLSGCVFHSFPEDNQEFYQISQISELAGVYKNKGDPSGYFSAIIWGDLKLNTNPETSHEDIEYIEVSPMENSLTVKAIKRDCTIYEKSYIIERDFKIDEGKIFIHRDASLLTRGTDDVLVGPSYEKVVLGIDTQKHGKFRSSGYAAGLVFLLLPVAISDTSDIRFERVKDKPQGFKACSNH